MKKLISLVLVLALVMGLSVATFAAATGNDTTKDNTTATFTVKYTAAYGTAPTETFTFSAFTCTGVTDSPITNAADAPVPATIPAVEVASGATGTATITLPTYNAVGVYTYTFKQVAGNTAGVTYYKAGSEQIMKLVVSVVNDPASDNLFRIAAIHVENGSTDDDKTGEIENTYTAGDLEVTKTVTGNAGDKSKEFKITVTLTSDKPVNSAVKNGDADVTFTKGDDDKYTATVVYNFANGGKGTITNIPAGVKYTVDEDDYSAEGYTTTGEVTTATEIATGKKTTVGITNEKNITIDTGVILESLPYVVIGLVVAAAVVVLIVRKTRKVED